jgi:two-component system chemotaxis response regulator CheB
MTTPPARKSLAAGDRIRVLVVDDSVVIRRALSLALGADPCIEVVGVAASGEIALQLVDQLNPDVVTLDVEMPGMGGLETLTQLRLRRPGLRIIMVSSLTQSGASVTIEALSRGADDYVAKSQASSSIPEAISSLGEALSPKVRQFFRLPLAAASPPATPPAAPHAPRSLCRFTEVLLIAASTGGPTALAAVIPQLPADFPLPVLVVQHMPPVFTDLLAQRLDSQSPLQVLEAKDGMPVLPGQVLIAPGDFHLTAVREGAQVLARLNQLPTENGCRPSADVLFRSAHATWGGNALVLVMTGMGQDGLLGTRPLHAQGARIAAQDEASSVVWGMPGEIVRHNLADAVLPLSAIPDWLITSARQTAR